MYIERKNCSLKNDRRASQKKDIEMTALERDTEECKAIVDGFASMQNTMAERVEENG